MTLRGFEAMYGHLVERRPDGHWLWLGPWSANGSGPVPLDMGAFTISPARLLYIVTAGEIPAGAVVRACREPRCIRPEHRYVQRRRRHKASRYTAPATPCGPTCGQPTEATHPAHVLGHQMDEALDLLETIRRAGGDAALLNGEVVLFLDPSNAELRRRVDAHLQIHPYSTRPALVGVLDYELRECVRLEDGEFRTEPKA